MERQNQALVLVVGLALVLPAGFALAQDDDDTNRTNGTNETNDTNETNETGNETAEDEKVVICHRPPGNPENAHTIEVGESARDGHMEHGDTDGMCPEEGNETSEDVDAARDAQQIAVEVDAEQDTEVEQNSVVVSNVQVEQTVQDADEFRMTFIVEGSGSSSDDVFLDEDDSFGVGAEAPCEEPAVILFEVDRVSIDVDSVHVDGEGEADITVQSFAGDNDTNETNDTENETDETNETNDTDDTADEDANESEDSDAEVDVDQETDVDQTVTVTQTVNVELDGDEIDRAASVDDLVIHESSEGPEFVVVDDPDEDVVFVLVAVDDTCEPHEGEVFTVQSADGDGQTDVRVPAPGLMIGLGALALAALAMARRRRG